MASDTPVCRILSLDGGGAKGFYTLGILRELEAMLPKPIHETFDLIFGTSTGSIIAAMLAAGMKVEDIKDHYCEHVPAIMRGWFKSSKTAALRKAGAVVFQDKKFDIFKTGIGIVSTRWHEETPMIFKSEQTQAHGLRATFVPGFGCTVADALEASCSGSPPPWATRSSCWTVAIARTTLHSTPLLTRSQRSVTPPRIAGYSASDAASIRSRGIGWSSG